MMEIIFEYQQFLEEKRKAEEAKRHIIHIRKPLPRRRGNQWYKDRSEYVSKTLCGADCGLYDVPLKDTKYKSFDIKDPFWLTKGEFCPHCLELANLKEK